MLIRISVRTLAEFIHRRGDLYPSLGGRVTAEEGLAMQGIAQQAREAGYVTELTVDETFEFEDLTLRVSGRIDGCDLQQSPPLIEEIKTTRAPAVDAEALLGSAHWAQATLYAALLSRTEAEPENWLVRLLYCHPDTHEQVPFEQHWRREDLCGYLERTLERYLRWMRAQHAWKKQRNTWVDSLPFPYGNFRPHQRAMAGRVYRAFQSGERLLLEAPTGSGKTMGVLYPALKALAGGHVDQLFFLTSRGTGAIAVRDACHDLADEPRQTRVLELIAKQKACPVPGMPCDQSCDYARGYYDRIEDAVSQLLQERDMHPSAVQQCAEQHKVCPFELSLDAALWADLVVGDYNYLLDPVVRLQRFSANSRLGLLIDESHQLADRARSMLSLSLTRQDVLTALAESPPARLSRRLKSVDRALLGLRRSLVVAEEAVIDEPAALLRSMGRALECLADDSLDLSDFPATREMLFNFTRWVRSEAWRNDHDYRFLAHALRHGGGRKQISVALACLDPAAYLAETLGSYGPHVRFSGTVTPLEIFQSLHGHPDSPAERVQSAFTAAQLAVLIVPDLPVYFRERHRTAPELADLVAVVCASRTGNYLVALPSFEYLEILVKQLSQRHPELALSVQSPGMDEPQRERFLDGFQTDGETRLGVIVLGGVFAESVDFSHAPLSGVICVGVGLPPGSILRSEIRDRFEERLGPGGGETVAFQQPAMTKVVQMTGRLLRGESDSGIVCLIDDRFQQHAFQRYFPHHWRPEVVSKYGLTDRIGNFWQRSTSLPKLRSEAPLPHHESEIK